MSKLLNVASAAAVVLTVAGVLMLSEPGNAANLVSTPSPVLLPVAQDDAAQAPAPTAQVLVDTTVAPAQEVVEPKPVVAPISAASLAALVDATPHPATMDEQLRCLAGTVYFESKGESLAGQLAVAHVVINRANSGRFPKSLCGVVYQRSQFSFVRGGRMPAIPEASRQWKNAVAIAQIAQAGNWKNQAPGALFFHARHVSPGWGRPRIAQIDNHIFYR